MNEQNQYDFSDSYYTEEINLGDVNGFPFIVTVTELSNETYVNLQRDFIGTLSAPENKKDLRAQLKNKQLDPTQHNDRVALAAVKSWTLRTCSGEDVPVCYDAWKRLTRRHTEAIEKAIERLNPTLSDDFPSEPESAD